MKIKKRKLADLDMVYAVRAVDIGGRTHLMAASESRGGKCLLFSPPDWRMSVAWDGPGGAMSLVPVPGRPGAVMAIQKFFPIFESEDAGLYCARAGDDPTSPWQLDRIADLPFAHRLEVVDVAGTPFMVAASVCGGKDFRDDWSNPGAVYVAPVAEDPAGGVALVCVLHGISRNHGVHVTAFDDNPLALIAGAEGLFALRIPGDKDGPWQSERWLHDEIGDVFAADLTGDGQRELVTIEPFHGNRLAVYQRAGGAWRSIYETGVDFGHVVWAGRLLGENVIIAGSRGGDRELAVLRVTATDPFAAERIVLDAGVGPTQIAVVKQRDVTLILSANHGAGEVALYELTPS